MQLVLWHIFAHTLEFLLHIRGWAVSGFHDRSLQFLRHPSALELARQERIAMGE